MQRWIVYLAAGLVFLISFLASRYWNIREPASLTPFIVSVGFVGLCFGLYRIARDWRPVGIFGLGFVLTYAPKPVVSTEFADLSVFVLELLGQLLILIGGSWALYRGWQSRQGRT